MFGYLLASVEGLTEEEFERYRSCYCGLCRTLKCRHGQISRLTLNYDMTFLVILLQSLYDFDTVTGTDSCIAHPRKKSEFWISRATEYASDMNVALAYLNCEDDWKDDSSLIGLAGKNTFKKEYMKVKEKWPVQIAAMEQSIMELDIIEKSNSEDADAAAATFGHLMGSVFSMREDRWSETLYNLGNSMGRFIYLLDAMVDLKKDAFCGDYNPFRKYYGLDNEQRFRDILKMFLADAIVEFEKLPLVDDTGILKNILCSGLWSEFERNYGSLQGTGHKPERNRRRNKKSIQDSDEKISSGSESE